MSLATLLHLVGYPIAVVPLFRLRSILRERRAGWFVAEEVGTALVVAGWLARPRLSAAVVNAIWGVGLAVAWVLVGRRRPPVDQP